MATIGKVRRMKHRDKKSIREISKQTSLSRITIRKWLKEPLDLIVGEPKPKRRELPSTVIKPFEAWLDLALRADGRRAKH